MQEISPFSETELHLSPQSSETNVVTERAGITATGKDRYLWASRSRRFQY